MATKPPNKRLRLSLAPSEPAGEMNAAALAIAAANCEQLEQARAELADAGFRIRAMLDAAGDEYLLIGRDLRILDVNDVVLRATGRARAQCLGLDYRDLVADETWRDAVAKAVRRDRSVQVEARSAFSPSRSVRLFVLPDEQGIVLFGRDVTKLTPVETDDDQIALMQSVIAAASDHVVLLDGCGIVRYLNKAPLLRAAGERRDGPFVPGVPYLDIVDSVLGRQPELIAAIERLLSGQGREFRAVVPIGPKIDSRHADVRVAGLDHARFRVILCWRMRERADSDARTRRDQEKVLLAREDERRRVARELHDSIQQDLAAIELGLHNLKNADPGPPSARAVSELRCLVNHAQVDVRASTFLMHPPDLGDGDLVAALERMAVGLMRRTSLKVELQPGERPANLPPAIARSLYRIAQEGMMNIYRHSRATRAVLRLVHGHDDVTLDLEDDGIGFDPTSDTVSTLGVGVQGMIARAEELDGSLSIERLDRGTLVRVRLPV